MKKTELIKLKKILQQELNRRSKINELLDNDLVREYLVLNNMDIYKYDMDDKWLILKEILQNFEITETNGILVLTGCFITECSICYEETDYYEKRVDFDNKYIEYQVFKDIENSQKHIAYSDDYIKRELEEENRFYIRYDMDISTFCHKRYGRSLVSELMEKYAILNPYNTYKNMNGFNEVQKDFYINSIEKGQPKAKQLVLSKYPQMR